MLLMQFSGNMSDELPPIGTWSESELQAHIAFMVGANQKLAASGELVDAQGLAMPATARIVRAGRDGAPLVTEGPFAETKEFLAGYWIVDCEGLERAVEIAAFVSTAPGPGGRPLNMPIEVRQVMSAPSEEM
ncbi:MULTISPECIES: YciI family protein [unclassified Kitasatospora]|uniref:YciI family protein n=1 Tax=unclassified Kitasatospora TaxID=2633591 RepID=UPI0024758847|nr:YciI family protein [Kitasatospora sp. MAP12-44]